MKIGILGTGVVGKTLAGKLDDIGQQVMVGTRSVAAVMAKTSNDAFGNPPFRVWREQHTKVGTGSFAQAAAFGEVVINATSGMVSLEALRLAGASNLSGKILIDVANPLDFSQGMPPSLSVCNLDSLGEQIQRMFPGAKVVKTLNTVNAMVMVSPGMVAGGDHDLFVCGNDPAAKALVAGYLKSWFGWNNVLDIGDISAARGAEMFLPLWLRLMRTMKSPMFNIKIAH